MATSSGRDASGGGRVRLLFRSAAGRMRRRGVERLTAAPATERMIEGLHRAAVGLAEVTSEVSAYAGLLEEKMGELRARTAARRSAGSPNRFSTAPYRGQAGPQEAINHQISP
ncbi:hypothetical protein [Streptosporangium sp. NPDC002607]